MNNTSVSVAFAGLLFLATACSNEGRVIAKNPDARPQVSLGDLKSQVQSGTPTITDAPEVDPAAININPLKTPENYLEREVFDEILIRAREEAGYLERSMAVTQDSLSGLPYTVSFDDYAKALEEAAIIHASSLNGDRPAHIAQKQTVAILSPILVMGERKDLAQPVSPIDFQRRTTDFRKRTYLNYFLTVDKLRAEKSREDIRARAEVIASAIPSVD
jgi:hypothetical protein